MSWTFEKVDIELLDNLNLNSHEKLIYILICRFKRHKNGVNVTNNYLLKRTGIKSKATLRKYLDRLANFGLCARNQPAKRKPNKFTFDKQEMQDFIRINMSRRNKLSKAMKKIKADKKYQQAIKDEKVIPILEVNK